MKKLLTIILFVTLSSFAGQLHINFNNASPTVDVEFNDLENIEIVEMPAGMVFVQGGTFQMGDHFNEGEADELPVHSVTVSNFYIGKYEVTQSEWATYMPTDTYDWGVGDDFPVYYLNWYETIKYCNLRSIAEGITPCYTISSSTDPADWGTVPTSSNATWDAAECNWSANGYRLPTEAEWEYAARGGIHNADNYRYSGCLNEADLTNYAWYYGNHTGASHPVGEKLPNQLGIYDMSGNLFEWCWDWYGISYYTTCNDLGVVTDPYGPATGSHRVERGGCWGAPADFCRVARHYCYDFPYLTRESYGVRVSRTP